MYRYAHLTTEDREKVRAVWATASKWLEDRLAAQETKGKAELVLSCAEIEQRARTAANECLPILNKPVPVPVVPEPEPEKKADEPTAPAAADGGASAEAGAEADAPAPAPAPAPEDGAEGNTTTPEEAKAE